MHPVVPSGRSRGFDELISEEASVVGVSGGITCDCEVETGHLLTQPIVHREFHRDILGWLDTCTGKGVVICSRGQFQTQEPCASS